jgi:hypothetical protein
MTQWNSSSFQLSGLGGVVSEPYGMGKEQSEKILSAG